MTGEDLQQFTIWYERLTKESKVKEGQAFVLFICIVLIMDTVKKITSDFIASVVEMEATSSFHCPTLNDTEPTKPHF